MPIILIFLFEIAVSSMFFHGGYITIKRTIVTVNSPLLSERDRAVLMVATLKEV